MIELSVEDNSQSDCMKSATLPFLFGAKLQNAASVFSASQVSHSLTVLRSLSLGFTDSLSGRERNLAKQILIQFKLRVSSDSDNPFYPTRTRSHPPPLRFSDPLLFSTSNSADSFNQRSVIL